MSKKIYKSNKNKMITGVCGGIGEFLNWDATIVRLIFIILAFIKGFGVLFYIIAALIIPAKIDYEDENSDVENLKSANIDEKSKSKKKNSEKINSKLHDDQDFDSYFKK